MSLRFEMSQEWYKKPQTFAPKVAKPILKKKQKLYEQNPIAP